MSRAQRSTTNFQRHRSHPSAMCLHVSQGSLGNRTTVTKPRPASLEIHVKLAFFFEFFVVWWDVACAPARDTCTYLSEVRMHVVLSKRNTVRLVLQRLHANTPPPPSCLRSSIGGGAAAAYAYRRQSANERRGYRYKAKQKQPRAYIIRGKANVEFDTELVRFFFLRLELLCGRSRQVTRSGSAARRGDARTGELVD